MSGKQKSRTARQVDGVQAASLDEAAIGPQQFVTFDVGGERFGLPLRQVQEIIRVPELVQTPLSPASLEGLANLRGAILPVTNLRRVLGAETIGHDDATRVVVVQAATPMGFVVDRMASVVTATPEQVEDAAHARAAIASDLIGGVIKLDDGVVLVLDLERLLQSSTHGDIQTGASPTVARGELRGDDLVDEVREVQLVSFSVAGQEYAFPIEEVLEIVQFPERVTRAPKAPAHVVGVMTLRERLLPLVSLREVFGLPAAAEDMPRRIVVVTPDRHASSAVGVVMDTVNEVLRVSTSLLDPVPALIGSAEAEITAMCRLDDGRRLVSILSASRLFGEAMAGLAGGEAEGQAVSPAGQEDRRVEAEGLERQLVVFRLGDEEYGLPIAAVQEIVRVPEDLCSVPLAPAFIEGVVNLRGAVLPVIDQRRRFQLAEIERTDRQRIMVLTLDDTNAGFIVDHVSEVLKIAGDQVEPAPRLSSEQAKVIQWVANLPEQDRMVLIIEPDHLLADDDLRRLAQAA